MAKLNWQLDSCKFSDVSACNPIMFTTENFWQDAASFVLRCYADKSLEGGRTNKLMKMLNKLDRPQQVKVSHGLVKKHLRIFQQHRKNPKKAFTVSKQDNSAAKIKEDLILIYKDILAPVLIKEIKQANSYKRCEEVLFQEFI
ncbi:hypothetical protein V8B55DRAFT_1585912 [Mucor lusitanicus]|uniref:Uncharacterized protein n=2 Tax=Mucor circinelloides f. lusitanicus TaxID=29924 RepID=A0A168MCU3_MUCCL|nr:hypothetical protein MUCCIDRAFT_79827 [Mucor lusitanicus CBS 277.49]